MAEVGVGTEVVPGVRRLGTRYVNWYLVEDGGGVAVVDASLPGYRPQLEPAHRTAFVGDSVCTWNPLTGRLGPHMPRAFGYSSADSVASLDRIEQLEADVVLPGQGEPWTDGAAGAAARAREAGPS